MTVLDVPQWLLVPPTLTRKEAAMTTEERLNRLERRLRHAKRHNRRLLAGAGLAIVACIAYVAWAVGPERVLAQPTATAPDEIHARKFVLEDASGKTRAVLGVNENGVGLYLYDANGKVRTALGRPKDSQRFTLGGPYDGSGLYLYDANGKVRTTIDVLHGMPRLHLCDAASQFRVWLDEAGLILYDAGGHSRRFEP